MNIFVLPFIFLLFLTLSSALYEHQAGVSDWSIKNAGLLDTLNIYDNQVFFTLKDDDCSIGALNLRKGNIEFIRNNSFNLVEKRFYKPNEVPEIIFTYDKKQSTIYFFSIKTASIFKSLQINTNFDVISIIAPLTAGIVIVTTNREILVLDPLGKQTNIYETKEESEIVKVFFDKNQKLWFLICNANNEILIKQGHLSRSKIEFAKEEATQKIILNSRFEKKNLIFANDYIIYEENELNLHYFSTESEVYQIINNIPNSLFIDETSVRVVDEGEKFRFYSLNSGLNKNLVEINTLTKSQTCEYAFSHDETSNRNSKTIIIGKICARKLQAYSVSLDKPYQTPTELFSKIINSDVGQIKSLWIKQDAAKNKFVIFQTQDLQTIFYSLTDNEIFWMREDSLAYVEKVHFVNFDDIESKTINNYYESLENEGTHNLKLLFINFVYRIRSEIDDFYAYIKSFCDYTVAQLKDLSTSTNVKDALQILNKLGDNTGYEIFYNLKKLVLFLTKYNTIYGVDSASGQIIWKKYLKDQVKNINEYKAIDIFSLESKHEEVISNIIVATFFSEKLNQFLILNISPLDGQIKKVEELHIDGFSKVVKIPASKHFHNEFLLIVDKNLKLKFYPAHDFSYVKEKESKLYFYLLDSVNRLITGYKVISSELNPTWNITLSENEDVITMKTLSSNDKGFLSHTLAGLKIAIHEDKKVLFKHINHNNFVILTKIKTRNEDDQSIGSLNLYIINGLNGRVLFNQYISDVNLGYNINLVVDDNGVFVCYFNQKSLGFEIWSIESYLEKMETSFLNMLEQYYFLGQQNEGTNYNLKNSGIIYLQQKYGLPFSIKSIGTFVSKYGMTRKNLVLITDKNQIYSLDRNLLSTRRSLKMKNEGIDLTNSFESVELAPYQYMIPINSFSFLSYHLQLSDLQHIHTNPTNLESTSLLLTYGRDIFFTKIAPDNNYDKLNEDFKYFYLVGTVFTVIGLTIFMKNYARKTRIYKIFNN